eukprot:TRINITY_DN10875_c0_g4_i1.p1 TRINITY_DN10875_c0_g4~~TRINITY_DN10875_c0_g4_i1.p1  ORF type:complete len:316 (+),score=110.62 TRINITY_DN10875_c0_g4_i1:1253-2200(+)
MDYELFKSQQSQLTEKITEMIKLEVETRLEGEKESKMVTEAIFTKFVDDMTAFKELMEKQNRRFAKDLKEVSTESSERSSFLSRYIEDLVKKQEESTDAQFQKIKLLCAKLTEEVKEHIQGSEKLLTDVKNEQAEMKLLLKESLEESHRNLSAIEIDMAVKMSLEQAANKIEFDNIYDTFNKLNVNLQTLSTQHTETVEALGKSAEESKANCYKVSEELMKKAEEQADKKIQATLEQLRKANQDVWDFSLKLSDKMFSREGRKDILDLVPPQVLRSPDIKGQLGDLVVETKGEYPKPRLDVPEDEVLSRSDVEAK